jgi:hypothetical protein
VVEQVRASLGDAVVDVVLHAPREHTLEARGVQRRETAADSAQPFLYGQRLALHTHTHTKV